MPTMHDLTYPSGRYHWFNILRMARSRAWKNDTPYLKEVRELMAWADAMRIAEHKWKNFKPLRTNRRCACGAARPGQWTGGTRHGDYRCAKIITRLDRKEEV